MILMCVASLSQEKASSRCSAGVATPGIEGFPTMRQQGQVIGGFFGKGNQAETRGRRRYEEEVGCTLGVLVTLNHLSENVLCRGNKSLEDDFLSHQSKSQIFCFLRGWLQGR